MAKSVELMEREEWLKTLGQKSGVMRYTIEFERETDGRWIAEIPTLPGAMAYGASKNEAEAKVRDLALVILATEPR